jgi:hypothetical protein
VCVVSSHPSCHDPSLQQLLPWWLATAVRVRCRTVQGGAAMLPQKPGEGGAGARQGSFQ